MRLVKFTLAYLKEWRKTIIQFILIFFMSSSAKNLEILALRSQLALFQQQVINKKRPKPRGTVAFKQLCVILSKVHSSWRSIILIVQPKTVLRWEKIKWRRYWGLKCKKKGRPKISPATIALIKRIHKETPLLSPEKIHELLRSMGAINPPAPNTIAKYIPSIRKPPSEKVLQNWKTFIKNHIYETWSMDYLVVPTIRFKVLYILIIISHGDRKIVHFAVTSNPTLDWVMQQIRNATPFDNHPKYLIHDNDAVFVSKKFTSFLASTGITSKRTAIRSPWQNGIVERMNGILRQELLDHIIPFNEKHLHRLLSEYINDYYNTHRTHQGINCKTPVPLPEYEPVDISNIKLKSTPVLSGLYPTYERIA